MLFFEIKKLWSHKIVVGLFLLFLLVSGVVFHLYEQRQPAYLYIYQGREQYESFLQGELVVDEYSFYLIDAKKQENYKENYQMFLDEMENRAQQTILLLANSNQASYVYSNAEKTCKDYEELKDIQIVADNCYGVIELAKYDWGIYFVIGIISVLAFFVFFDERKKGLLLLVKGTKNGHVPLVGVKLLIMVMGALLFTFLQEMFHVLMIGHYYGYGDLGRSIQSVPEFRNCPFEVSVGEGILWLVVERIWIAIVISILVSVISLLIRNELLAVLSFVVLLIVEFAFCMLFSLTGSFNILKCVNLFYFWNMQNLLATYLNLNILGTAVGKGTVAVIVSVVLVTAGMIAGIQIFRHKYQIRTESRLEKILLWWRKKTAFLWQNVSLLWFEIYKVLMQQKRMALILLMVVLCGLRIQDLNAVKYYDNAYEATYNNYMKKISGQVTDESIAFIKEEKAYIDDLKYRWENLEDPQGKDYVLNLQLSSELVMKEEATNMMVEQLEQLQAMDGSIYDKYFVNESAYLNLWGDAASNGYWWFVCAAFIIIWLSGVYPADRKKEVYLLVQTTKNGREELDMRKNGTIAIGFLVFFGMTQGVKLLEIYYLDQFQCFGKPLSEFTSVSLKSGMTIGLFMLLILIIRVITLIAITVAGVYFSRKVLNEIITNIVGVGVVGMITCICITFQICISGWLLNFMFL